LATTVASSLHIKRQLVAADQPSAQAIIRQSWAPTTVSSGSWFLPLWEPAAGPNHDLKWQLWSSLKIYISHNYFREKM
jgi:hypothetical protein